MRLNRVLLLAATVSMMMFALVFTISCSGDDGAPGKAGEGCTVVRDGNNWNIICDGSDEIVGTLKGSNGVPGAQGTPGADGEDCWLGPKTGQGYEVLCGTGSGTSKGFLNGCSVKAVTDYESLITCGSTEVNICGQVRFDPTEETCTSGLVVEGGTVELLKCGTEKEGYNPNKKYCGFQEGDDDKVMEKYPNGTKSYPLCPTGTNGPQPNKDEWADEYCRYISKDEAVVAGDAAADFCDGQKYNDGRWRGEYCGWASVTATKKTLLSGACDEPNEEKYQGPNERSFGEGYCAVLFENKSTGITTYSEDLCGTSANNKPNNGSWKNEYCGFAEGAKKATKVWVGLCDDSEKDDLKAPHLTEYNAGYCAVEFEEGIKLGSGKTVFVEKGEICDDGGKPNEGTWKGEYCGVAESGSKATKLYSGMCDDGQGPNQNGWNPKEYCAVTVDAKNTTGLIEGPCDNGDKINEGSWKGEYCGYKDGSAKTTSGLKGACADGDGPHTDGYNASFCEVLFTPGIKIGDTTSVKSENFCGDGGKQNEGSWKGEYCGYSSAKDEENEIMKVQKAGTICGDGKGPNEDSYNAGYCQWPDELATGTLFTSDSCGKSTVNKDTWQGQYCFADSKVKTCKAGLVPIPGAKSTDKSYCATPSIINFCLGVAVKGTVASYDGNLQKCKASVTDITATGFIDACTGASEGIQGKDGIVMLDSCVFTVASREQCKAGGSYKAESSDAPNGSGTCKALNVSTTKCKEIGANAALNNLVNGTTSGRCEFYPGLNLDLGGDGGIIIVPQCDASHLSLCENSGSCGTAGGWWSGSVCEEKVSCDPGEEWDEDTNTCDTGP